MPQFDLNPSTNTQVLGDPNSGDYDTYKKVKGKRRPVAQKKYSGISARQEAANAAKAAKNQATQGGASSGPSAGGRGAGGRGGNNNNQQSNAPAAYNPLNAEFKTPAQLRKEAAELAALSVASEDILRQQQAREEAGLTGLTSALSGRLGDIAAQQTAGLQGFGSLYGRLAGSAQTAGGAALAAAGADPGLAAGANPLVAGQLANLSAPLMGYQPAAEAIGQRLIGASQGALGKALMERSAQLSANTAKYLRDLQDTEIQRAVSQGTLAQNEARLGLTAEENQWERQVDTQRLQQGWQRLAQSAANAGAKAGKDKAKAIKNTKAQILADLDQWTGATVPTGKFEYTVYFTDPIDGLKKLPKTFVAMSEAEAIEQAKSSVPQNRVDTISAEKGEEQLGQPTAQQIIRQISAQLVNQGMSRRNAQAWVRKFVLAPAGLNVNTSGAFMGGVGGSVT
jgi:hypothetical protein